MAAAGGGPAGSAGDGGGGGGGSGGGGGGGGGGAGMGAASAGSLAPAASAAVGGLQIMSPYLDAAYMRMQQEQNSSSSSSASSSFSSSISASASSSTALMTEKETRELAEADKRMRRLIKNRLSARENRRRKKEHVQRLREEAARLEAENLNMRIRLKAGPAAEAAAEMEVKEVNAKLDAALRNGASEMEMLELVDSIKEKYADYGNDNRSALAYHFQRLRELVVPGKTTKAAAWSIRQLVSISNPDGTARVPGTDRIWNPDETPQFVNDFSLTAEAAALHAERRAEIAAAASASGASSCASSSSSPLASSSSTTAASNASSSQPSSATAQLVAAAAAAAVKAVSERRRRTQELPLQQQTEDSTTADVLVEDIDDEDEAGSDDGEDNSGGRAADGTASAGTKRPKRQASDATDMSVEEAIASLKRSKLARSPSSSSMYGGAGVLGVPCFPDDDDTDEEPDGDGEQGEDEGEGKDVAGKSAAAASGNAAQRRTAADLARQERLRQRHRARIIRVQQEVLEVVSPSRRQSTQLQEMSKVLDKLTEDRAKLVASLRSLEDLITEKNQALDDEMRSMQQILTPRQTAKFILWVHSNQACMLLLNQLWGQVYAY